MRIQALGVDSGDGSRVTEVYDYVRPRQTQAVWPTKGSSDRRMKEPVRIAKRSKTTKVRILHINTYAMKATLFARLKKQIEPGQEPPWGHYFFRAPESEWHNGSDAEFFAQFGREVPKRKRLPNGQWVTEWQKKGPNEAIDLEAGCLAMLRLLMTLDPKFAERLPKLAEQARQKPEEAKPKVVKRPRRNSYVDRWKN